MTIPIPLLMLGSTMLAQTEPEQTSTSWLQTIHKGGVIGYVIIALSFVGVALVIMHLVQIRRKALMPPQHIDALEELLARGETASALEYCLAPENDSYLTRILASGLTRYLRSAFGAFELKSALEEAGEEQTARLFRSTDALGVMGQVAPLLGLLGTVQGMVGAFASLSTNFATEHERLAGYLSLALVATLLGLCVAIPAVALFTFFRNRIDSFAAEAAQEIERLVLHLESPGPAPAGAARPMRPAPLPSPTQRMSS